MLHSQVSCEFFSADKSQLPQSQIFITATKVRSCSEGFSIWFENHYIELVRSSNNTIFFQLCICSFVFKCFLCYFLNNKSCNGLFFEFIMEEVGANSCI